jgi:hypothetical protein
MGESYSYFVPETSVAIEDVVEQRFGKRLADAFGRQTLSDLSRECSFVAMALMLNIYGKDSTREVGLAADLIVKLGKFDSHILKEMVDQHITGKGLGYSHIIKVVTAISDLIPDLRYNSQIRDVSGNLFNKGMSGIVALKSSKDNDNSTHWLSMVNGKLFIDEKSNAIDTMDKLRSRFVYFDGIGHRIVFWKPEFFVHIKNTYSQECDPSLCNLCGRYQFCSERRA